MLLTKPIDGKQLTTRAPAAFKSESTSTFGGSDIDEKCTYDAVNRCHARSMCRGGSRVEGDFTAHQLSPSSWNRYEECPRKYWLSRQRLPRKASMPAAMGTAVHNSVEDLCNLDLSDKDDSEIGWLPPTSKAVLDRHWALERDIFLATPRHPRWKDEMITKAHDGLVGALNILFSKSNMGKVGLSEVTVAQWKQVQSIVLSNEGTLVSECGRLMGRLDLLVADLDENGDSKGWIVADLKTGNPPSTRCMPTHTP